MSQKIVAIHTERLSRSYGDLIAVEGLDLEIGAGEIYGLLGPNGAGKTTAIRMLCTLLAPSSGVATVAGYNVASEPHSVRLHIGVALQEVALDPKQTGTQLLRLQGRLYGLSRDQIGGRLTELASLIQLGAALDRPIASYSGGMRRRLDLAAALIHRPKVLFLDEPTTGLDPASRSLVWDEVRRLRAELGMAVLLTTQYLEEADELADRVGIIDGGRLVAEGTPQELKRRVSEDIIVVNAEGNLDSVCLALRKIPGVDRVEMAEGRILVATDDGPSTIGPIAVAVERQEAGLTSLELRTATLDDVFLALTGARLRQGSDRDGDGEVDSMQVSGPPAEIADR